MKHQVFISYRHESPELAEAVRSLGERLRKSELPVVLDQFYLDDNPGGPDEGWPMWCEDGATQSTCILIIASRGWFTAYSGTALAGEGLGAATEASLFRQALWDEKANNARIRLVFFDDINSKDVPIRLRAWEPFRLYKGNEELDRLIRWVGDRIGAKNKLPNTGRTSRAGRKLQQNIPNPYPGLVAFKPEDSRFFFGREADTDRVIKHLKHSRFVSVIGGSGTGKSSLVAAGVEPALRQIQPTLTYLRFKPKADPFEQLAEAIDRQLVEERVPLGTPRVGRIRQLLQKNPTQAVEDYLGKLKRPVLVFADQFEELFTQTSADTALQFRAVIEAVRQHEASYLILTLRSEFMHRLMAWLGGEQFKDTLEPLDPIDDDERLRAIIIKPAGMNNVPVQPDLLARLLPAARTMKGALPLLALTLERLFEQRDPQHGLTLDAYTRVGGLESIVQTATAEIDAAIDADSALARACERLFAELATVIDEVPTRRTAEVTPLRTDEHIGQLVEALRAQGLLADPDDRHIEFVHEMILTHWPRLSKWLAQYSDKLALRRQARLAATDWHRARGEEVALPGLPRQSDFLRWTWERQRPALEALLALSHLTAQPDPDYADSGIYAWHALENTLDEPLRDFLYPEPLRLLREIEIDHTSHQRREEIGLRLNQMGDPRRGTGLDEQRLPDIAWIDIPHGEVTLETDPAKTFPVDAFRIAKYPVTWAQYRVFLNAQDGYHDPRWWIDLHQRQEPGREQWAFANYPVIIVSWYDAVAFCRWLSSRRGLEGISSIRLPTEWEWQWVAQSGNERREYPWGEWHPSRANTRDGGIGRTIAVGMYPLGEPDAWAVLDLAGNVLEWCLNEYHVPENISIGNGGIRVLRGGSWNDPPADCGVAHRDGRGGPAFRLIYYGFRVCCSAPID